MNIKDEIQKLGFQSDDDFEEYRKAKKVADNLYEKFEKSHAAYEHLKLYAKIRREVIKDLINEHKINENHQ